jgi:Flp pilus assembly protein TadB
MARIVRFILVLAIIFGAISLLQSVGLSKETAIMFISIAFVAIAVIVKRRIKKQCTL